MRTACEAAGIKIAGEASSHDTLRAGARKLRSTSVIVSELAVLEPDPADTVRELSSRHRVLIVDDAGVDHPRLLREGASGFVGRELDPSGLCRAVAIAHEGGLVLNVNGREQLPLAGDAELTPRELDVLRLIAGGGSTCSAARDLHMGPTTVKTHLRNAGAKLGTRGRAAAVAKAATLGLLEQP